MDSATSMNGTTEDSTTAEVASAILAAARVKGPKQTGVPIPSDAEEPDLARKLGLYIIRAASARNGAR